MKTKQMMRLTGATWLAAAVLLSVATSLWADGGWYLLIPPRSEYNESAAFLSAYKILDNAPLSKWAQQGAYDSAEECETVKSSFTLVEHNIYSSTSQAYIKAIGAGTDPAVLKMQRFSTETHNANVDALRASRCIRSDDPRLLR